MNKQNEKKAFLLGLKEEINTLEKKVKGTKLANLKIKGVRALKISKRIFKMVYPHIIATVMLLSGSKLIDSLPFVRDEQKFYQYRLVDRDVNNKMIKYKEEYSRNDYQTEIITFYSPYEKSDDKYVRTVTEYALDDYTYEDIIALIDDNESIFNSLGEPRNNYIEYSTINNETVESLNGYGFIITNTELDKNTYIIKKESIDDNTVFTFAFILLEVLSNLLIFTQRKSDKYSLNFKDIKERYRNEDISVLKKKLAIKVANYERLISDNNDNK